MSPILTSGNATLLVTNLSQIPENRAEPPLGTADGSATGELGTKVIVIGQVTPPTVNGVKVVGIQEVDTWATKNTDYTAAAGALSILFNPSPDFVGTVNSATWSGSAGTAANQGAVSRTAQPGNTLPAFIVTRSAGTFLMAEARPT